ncbi:DUF4199 domain-containing protein [Hymenobacter koreensis]|uniref:DUF4199 domain-containing protein n=1 Tax=Hymenobacter koreensis TaxID=1084523 RepID=A0ABP8J4K2_9BACT
MENTATPSVSPSSAGIRYGLIFGVISIIVDFVLKATGLSFKFSVTLSASLIIWVVGIIVAHRYFKAHNGGFMSYGQGIIIAVIMGSIGGLMTGVFNYVYVNFIDPNYAEAMRADMEAWLIKMNVPEEQMDKSLADITPEKIGSPTSIGSAILFGAFVSLLTGLIISAITKRKQPEFE